MLNSDQILQVVLRNFGHICDCPLMYGGDANGVEVVLWTHHRLWAEIVERIEEYNSTRYAQFSECGCGSNSFSGHYRDNIQKGYSVSEAVRYSVEQWKAIDRKLGLVVPETFDW